MANDITIGGAPATSDQLAALRGALGTATSAQQAALLQRNAQAAGAYVLDAQGTLYGPDGSPVVNPALMPTPRGNRIGLIGDSRFANSAEASGELVPNRLVSYGMPSWLQHYSEYRGRITAISAVNGAKLNETLARLQAAAGNSRENSPVSLIDIAIFNGGVNGANLGSNDDASRYAPIYQQIIQLLTAAGIVCIWMNEYPTNSAITSDTNTLAYQNYQRRLFIDRYSRTGFNPQPADGKNLLVPVNVYDVAALEPGSSFWKPGFIVPGENLHPCLYGNKMIAKYALGPVLRAVLIKGGFQSRAILPIGDTDASFLKVASLVGTGGGRFTGWTGVTANGWNVGNLPTGLTGVASKGVDSNGHAQQIFRVTGTITGSGTYDVKTTRFDNSNLGATGGMGVSGNKVYQVGRVAIDAGAIGLISCGMDIACNDNTAGQYLSGAVFSSDVKNNSGIANGGWDGNEAFDAAMLSQPCTLGAGWDASTQRSIVPAMSMNIITGVPVDFTVRLSDVGIIVGA